MFSREVVGVIGLVMCYLEASGSIFDGITKTVGNVASAAGPLGQVAGNAAMSTPYGRAASAGTNAANGGGLPQPSAAIGQPAGGAYGAELGAPQGVYSDPNALQQGSAMAPQPAGAPLGNAPSFQPPVPVQQNASQQAPPARVPQQQMQPPTASNPPYY